MDLCLKLLVALEISIGIGVLNVAYKWMLLAYFEVVISKLILVVLVLSTFNFILVGIFGVLVEIGLALTVNAYLEHFLGFTISTRCSDSIFDCFESLVDICECVKVSTFNVWLKGSLTTLCSLDSFP